LIAPHVLTQKIKKTVYSGIWSRREGTRMHHAGLGHPSGNTGTSNCAW
jgi:hypothetical protein